jgi:hypothetical protein
LTSMAKKFTSALPPAQPVTCMRALDFMSNLHAWYSASHWSLKPGPFSTLPSALAPADADEPDSGCDFDGLCAVHIGKGQFGGGGGGAAGTAGGGWGVGAAAGQHAAGTASSHAAWVAVPARAMLFNTASSTPLLPHRRNSIFDTMQSLLQSRSWRMACTNASGDRVHWSSSDTAAEAPPHSANAAGGGRFDWCLSSCMRSVARLPS